MSIFLSKKERESLKRALVNPVKNFIDEVQDDTLGDAKRFYSEKARDVALRAKIARERAEIQTAAMKLEQEQRRKQRRKGLKRALILLAVLAALSLIVISVILNKGM